MKKIFFGAAVLLFFAFSIFAQGGKAEPNRITFAKGKTAATAGGSLKTREVAEYIFSAKKGPKNKAENCFDFPERQFSLL